MLSRALFAGLPLVLVAALFSAPRPAEGCAIAPMRGQTVGITDEVAVILWDEKTSTEHFIRRASFRTDARDFGFIVPTPDKPELAEVENSVFGELEAVTAPKVITKS